MIDKAKEKIGYGYVLGSSGQIMTKEEIDRLAKVYGTPTVNSVKIAQKWIGKHCVDCSGLILLCAEELGYLTKGYDTSAQGLYDKQCEPITKAQLIEGDLVFRKNTKGHIEHVGLYVGNGKTIEAMSTSQGVCEGTIDSFNLFGRPKFYPVEKKFTIDDAIDLMAKETVKITTNPEYWKDIFKNNKPFNREYVEGIFYNIGLYLKLKGVK